MLERVPEHDRRVGRLEVGQLPGDHVRALGLALEPGRRAPARGERVEQRAVARPDVEHPPRGSDLVEAAGEPGAQPAEQLVAEAREAP